MKKKKRKKQQKNEKEKKYINLEINWALFRDDVCSFMSPQVFRLLTDGSCETIRLCVSSSFIKCRSKCILHSRFLKKIKIKSLLLLLIISKIKFHQKNSKIKNITSF